MILSIVSRWPPGGRLTNRLDRVPQPPCIQHEWLLATHCALR